MRFPFLAHQTELHHVQLLRENDARTDRPADHQANADNVR